MVRAILEGRKTQTRRVVKRGQVFSFCHGGDLNRDERSRINAGPFRWERDNPVHPSYDELLPLCPYGVPGDRLWVREKWQWSEHFEVTEAPHPPRRTICYAAEGTVVGRPWRPSIFMRRSASRLTLEIVSVRVERLNEISEADAKAEGIHKFHGLKAFGYDPKGTPGMLIGDTAVEAFSLLWDSINAKHHSWASNPWVWVVEFKRLAAAGGIA